MRIHLGVLITAILVSGIFMPTTVMSAKEKSVSFDQYTFELVPGMSKSLRVENASMTCADGSIVSGPLFHLDARKVASSKSGSWGLLAAHRAALGDKGSFDRVKVTNNDFQLQGSWEGIMGRNKAVICIDAALLATVVFKGACGEGAVVIFKASNGVSGSFKGDVKC
jgi:hypothetical protein